MTDIQYAHLHITPTLRRVLAVLSDMPGGATIHHIAMDVYAEPPRRESGLRCLRAAMQLGLEQGLLMAAAERARNKPGARGPKAVVYMVTLLGLQHVEASA